MQTRFVAGSKDATHSYMPMFVGVIVLMAATIVTVVAIGRMQAKRPA